MRYILGVFFLIIFVLTQTEDIQNTTLNTLINQVKRIVEFLEINESDLNKSAKPEEQLVEKQEVVEVNVPINSDSHNNYKSEQIELVGPTESNETLLYKKILTALESYKSEVYVGVVNADEVFETFKRVLTDHPEIFYVKSGSRFTFNGLGTLSWQLAYPKHQIIQMQEKFNEKTKHILSAIIDPNDSELNKVLAIHDYIVNNNTYDYENFQKGTIPQESYTAYGALIVGRSVCEGYAEAVQWLLNNVGIKNEYVVGTSRNQAHAWNLVNIDGAYYHLDATWDDPVSGNGMDILSYRYFLISSSELRKDHKWNKSEYPKAESKRYAYFHSISDADRHGAYIYYTNSSDNERLYKISVDGEEKTALTEERAIYPLLAGEYVYYSNYSNSGFLFKIRTDGTNKTKMSNFHALPIKADNQFVYYKDEENDNYYKLPIRRNQE